MSDAVWTRAKYMTKTRNYADATGSGRWTDDEVREALGAAHAAEWKRLLNANRVLRASTRTVTQDASGQIALSALDSGSGDSQQRTYRVLTVIQGTRIYDEMSFMELPNASSVSASTASFFVWYRLGDVIQLLPIESSASMTITVNHLPTPIDQLSSDTVAAEFPRDYEAIVALSAAAELLDKGGAESGASDVLSQRAEAMREDMLSDLARTSTAPTRMGYTDSRWDWGG